MSSTNQLPKEVYGPFLRFVEYKAPTDDSGASWRGSILYVCKKSFLRNLTTACVLEYQGETQIIPGEWLDDHEDWTFWKFPIFLQLSTDEQEVTYKLKLGEVEVPYQSWSFYVPGAEQNWHLASYSCSGFSHDVDIKKWMVNDDHPMVKNLMEVHKKKKIHACIGGGDQIYCDELFKLDIMTKWLEIPNRHERLTAKFTTEIQTALEDFYFSHYCEHFDVFSLKEMCAQLPNVMLWDDHDIFDGWGSYPQDMMDAPVFKGIFTTAKKFYLLFQHHTTPGLVEKQESDLFTGAGETPAMSFLKYMGPTVALLGVDIRSERTKNKILEEESWKDIFYRLANISPSVRHLIVLFTVPIVYPHVSIAEAMLSLISVMGRISIFNAILVKTNIVSSKTFGEPELLDDLVDHWTSPSHLQERTRVVESFQRLALQHDLRVSFLSGDVHCAGLGRFYTYPKLPSFGTDPHFMPQLITSAIINEPPPDTAITLMHSVDMAGNRVNSTTREKMVKLFKEKYPREQKVLPKRNFLTIENRDNNELNCTFYIENSEAKEEEPDNFNVVVPQLKNAYSGAGRKRPSCILTSVINSVLPSALTPSPSPPPSPSQFTLGRASRIDTTAINPALDSKDSD